jgi:hypothetical protein
MKPSLLHVIVRNNQLVFPGGQRPVYIYMYRCGEYAGNPSYKWGNIEYKI